MRRGPSLPSLDDLAKRIAAEARPLGVAVSAEDAHALATHLRLLYVWNARVNLTAIRDFDEGLRRHTLESLEAFPFLPEEGVLADLGSGNGYPALPCLQLKPGLRGFLCESVARKIDFLRAAVRDAGLGERVFASQGRIEGPESLPAGVTVATMRGFPSPSEWAPRLFEIETLESVVAWVSEQDAGRMASEASVRSLAPEVCPLRMHPSGALLVLRRA